MIILDIGFQKGIYGIYLKTKEQIIGSQTWIHEYPSGLGARCHHHEGGFSVEELQIDPGPISFAQKYLMNSCNSFDDFKKINEIEEAWNQNVADKTFSEQEWETLLSKGFLEVFKMKYPIISENKIFNFYTRLDENIRDLENNFKGKPYSEILKEIGNCVDPEDIDNSWNVINIIYTKYSVWIKDLQNGKGGLREDYLHFLEIENQIKSNSTSQLTSSSKKPEILNDEH